MKQALKRFAIRVFLADKLRGRVVTLIAGTAASYVLAYVPGAPAIVQLGLQLLFDLPTDVPLTHEAVTASLVLPTSYVIDAAIQEFLIRQNNKTLKVIAPLTSYDGPIDGLVGPVARAAIEERLLQFDDQIQDER